MMVLAMGRIMSDTVYRRQLPPPAIEFSSAEGRRLFAEALAEQGLNGYFPLSEQYHTQADPSFCGLASLVVALNALSIDPNRQWKGPWRWFSEELLDCCVSLTDVRGRGIDLDEFACLARCNGAHVELNRADEHGLEIWHQSLLSAASGEAVVVASYDRALMGQTGSGHFSPIGGYHQRSNHALILDVARFKYPAHWVPADLIWKAMSGIDPASGLARGWIVLQRGNAVDPSRFGSCCEQHT
jgi:glutathione gamma-glutamylcysteinyltransferase